MQTSLPIWDADCGRLFLDQDLIRIVRKQAKPTNIEKILDAFEAAGWPASIPNPLLYGAQQLHEAVRSLNTDLAAIRFHALGGARRIWWGFVDSEPHFRSSNPITTNSAHANS